MRQPLGGLVALTRGWAPRGAAARASGCVSAVGACGWRRCAEARIGGGRGGAAAAPLAGRAGPRLLKRSGAPPRWVFSHAWSPGSPPNKRMQPAGASELRNVGLCAGLGVAAADAQIR